jgi:hypothetical protein
MYHARKRAAAPRAPGGRKEYLWLAGRPLTENLGDGLRIRLWCIVVMPARDRCLQVRGRKTRTEPRRRRALSISDVLPLTGAGPPWSGIQNGKPVREADRIRAAELLLAYGWGKPPEFAAIEVRILWNRMRFQRPQAFRQPPGPPSGGVTFQTPSSRRMRTRVYSTGVGSAGTRTALNRAPRQATVSTPRMVISSLLQPNVRT